jgi:thiaminase/transcriptional activator TenA
MSFSAELRQAADALWRAQLEHPLVRGIGDGTVSPQRFARWVRQDYLFLVGYCRALALAAARAQDLTTLRGFADLLAATAGREMDLHRSFAAEFGISTAELEAEEPAQVTRAYTDFLLCVATLGDGAELYAALLPCMWGFAEIGCQLAQRGRPAEPRCARWIDAYADPDFQALAEWCRGLVDRAAQGVGSAVRERMREVFLTSSRYELAFWDA